MIKPSTPPTAQALRDARLAKALQHAPDADALPSPALRKTIKTIATSAIGVSARGQLDTKNSWWHSWWASTGSARGPWGGALATLVLGSIITAMWYGQEVPDEKVRYSGEAAKVVSADASAPAPAPMQERAATTTPLAKSAAQEAMPAAKMKVPVPPEQLTVPAAPTVFAEKSKEQPANDVAAESRAADASHWQCLADGGRSGRSGCCHACSHPCACLCCYCFCSSRERISRLLAQITSSHPY
jgi:hypothetical protein